MGNNENILCRYMERLNEKNDIENLNKYIIASHGCAKSVESENKFFTLKSGQIVVYYNSIGVSSHGIPNIPFVVYLHKYNRPLFDYIFNIDNYGINLDKNNVRSYRHSDFFKQLPFYSDVNNVCNIEMYDGDSDDTSKCPDIFLTFDFGSQDTFHTGIVNFDNIVYFNRNKNSEIINIKSDKNDDANKMRNLFRKYFENETMMRISLKNLLDKYGDGIYFVSACRAQFYADCDGNMKSFKLHSFEKGCKTYEEYDKKVINNVMNNFRCDKTYEWIPSIFDVKKDIDNYYRELGIYNSKYINNIISNQSLYFYDKKDFSVYLYDYLFGNLMEHELIVNNHNRFDVICPDVEYNYVICTNKNLSEYTKMSEWEKNLYNLKVSFSFSAKTKHMFETLRLLGKFLSKYENRKNMDSKLFVKIYNDCTNYRCGTSEIKKETVKRSHINTNKFNPMGTNNK